MFAIATNTHMKRILILPFILMNVCHALAQGKSIAVIPATVSFNLEAGQTGTQKIKVTNNLSEKKTFRLSLMDWDRDTTGGHVKMKAGTYSHSCANWVTLNKTGFSLEPGQTEEVSIQLHIPDSANAVAEMKWTMLNCTTVEEKAFGPMAPNKMRAGLQQQMEFGIHIYQTPPNITNRSVKLISFSKIPEKPGHYKVVCQNTGATQLEAKCYIELSALAAKSGDDKKIKVGPKKFPLFPGQRRVVDLELPEGLAKGKYTAIAAVDGGSDVPLEAAQGVIEVK